MTTLVGYDGTAAWQSMVLKDTVYYSPFTAVASGVADTVHLNGYTGSGDNIKVVVYDASGNQLGVSTAFVEAAGEQTAAISLSAAIVLSTVYFLGVIFDDSGDGEIAPYTDTAGWNTKTNATGSYASPPSAVTTFSDGGGNVYGGHPAIWLTSTDMPTRTPTVGAVALAGVAPRMDLGIRPLSTVRGS